MSNSTTDWADNSGLHGPAHGGRERHGRRQRPVHPAELNLTVYLAAWHRSTAKSPIPCPRDEVGSRPMAKFAVILPAAGRSSRFQDKHYKKPFAPLADRAVWLHSAERFLNRSDVVQVILVIAPEDREDFNFKFAANVAILGIEVVDGGAERADSVAGRPGPGEAGGRLRLRSRRRPALPDRRLDRRDLRTRPRRPGRPSSPFRSPAR